MMIKLFNFTDRILNKEPVSVGIPCPKGKVSLSDTFVLKGKDGSFPVQAEVLNTWHDNSVKWLLCDFLVNMRRKEKFVLALEQGTSLSTNTAIQVKNSKGTIEIDTGEACFFLDTTILRPFLQISVTGENLLKNKSAKVWIKDKDNQTQEALIDKIGIESHGAVRLTLKVQGHFGQCEQVLFGARLHFFAYSAKCHMEITIHNPKAAVHENGLWDLGDPSSFIFKEFALSLLMSDKNKDDEVRFKPTPVEQWKSISSANALRIYQESSGGENWDSPAHCNRHARVPMTFRGYQILQNEQIVSEGLRAQPVIWMGAGAKGLSFVVPQFWQEFPKALDVHTNMLRVSFLPECFPDFHELQGGEQKTHSIYFDFATLPDYAGWGVESVQVSLDSQSINDSNVFPDIVCGQGVSQEYQNFLNAAMKGQNSFFAKREAVDEYGWRNYGDLYADHEGVNHKGKKLFVSHYNNQYDCVASFYREFYRTGETRWAELASDLAKHVTDIDINHTDHDREEYCHGLFWHTDHYLHAATSSHRMSSKEHLKQKNPAFCGGGPGAEHCYTTGLMLHYLRTGDPRYRDAVIKLADWSLLSLRGPQTVLGATLRTKKKFMQWLQNRQSSSVWSRYPLTRETGNCLNACLDAFELSGDKQYLATSFDLISGTIHPADDVKNRDLLNAEANWSYTVFLVSVVKYLEKKREIGEVDKEFYYAQQGFLHYVQWMEEYEYLTLSKPDFLEYPNETWAAQDLRKGLIFFHAAKYAAPELKAKFCARGKSFLEESFRQLNAWDTKYLTRPMALVLQNGWVDGQSAKYEHLLFREQGCHWEKSPFRYSLSQLIGRIVSDFIEVSKRTNISRELAWLRARL